LRCSAHHDLGRNGAGKSFLLNFPHYQSQKYDPYTFIFDLVGAFESLTQLLGGSYVRVGLESEDSRSIRFRYHRPRKTSISRSLPESVDSGPEAGELDPATERDLFHQVENLYRWTRPSARWGVLANTLGHDISSRLAKWTRGGQFGFLFRQRRGTISFSRFNASTSSA